MDLICVLLLLLVFNWEKFNISSYRYETNFTPSLPLRLFFLIRCPFCKAFWIVFASMLDVEVIHLAYRFKGHVHLQSVALYFSIFKCTNHNVWVCSLIGVRLCVTETNTLDSFIYFHFLQKSSCLIKEDDSSNSAVFFVFVFLCIGGLHRK